jgi:hypothetical protein
VQVVACTVSVCFIAFSSGWRLSCLIGLWDKSHAEIKLRAGRLVRVLLRKQRNDARTNVFVSSVKITMCVS